MEDNTLYIKCNKCSEVKGNINFWTYKNNIPDCMCKNCIINSDIYNPYNEEGIINFCKRYDIPFIKSDYNHILETKRNKKEIPYLIREEYITVYGCYLSKMKLCGFKSYNFSDSNRFNEALEYKELADKVAEAGLINAYPAAEIEKGLDKMAEHDNVNAPAHYTEGRKYEPVAVIQDWQLDFALGNTVKYISRAGRKSSAAMSDLDKEIEDLEKARFYLNYKIKELEELRDTKNLEEAMKKNIPDNVGINLTENN